MKKWIIILLVFVNLFSVAKGSSSYAIISDSGQFDQSLDYLKNSILSFNEHKLIMVGDQVYEHGRPHADLWNSWFKDFDFVAVALGNHNQGYNMLRDYFGMPGEYYTIKDGDSLFIVLNSDNRNSNSIKQQVKFLERELQTAHSPFIFVLYHHPFATVGMHSWQEREEFHNKTLPIIRKYKDKITAMFFGHDHIASVLQLDSIPVFITGSTYQSRPSQYHNYDDARGFKVKTLWNYMSGRYWLRMKLDTKLHVLHFDYIRTDENYIDCSIQVNPGHTIDVQENCWR